MSFPAATCPAPCPRTRVPLPPGCARQTFILRPFTRLRSLVTDGGWWGVSGTACNIVVPLVVFVSLVQLQYDMDKARRVAKETSSCALVIIGAW